MCCSLSLCLILTGHAIEARILLALLNRFINEILGLDTELRGNFRTNTVELVLSLAAVALVAIAQQAQHNSEGQASARSLRDDVHKALSAFDLFAKSEKVNIQIMGEAARARQEEKWITNRRAAKSIVDTLLTLTNAGRFSPSGIELVGSITHHLTEAFDKEDVFGDTFPVLQQLRLLCPVPQPGLQSSVPAAGAIVTGQSSSDVTAAKASTTDSDGPHVYGSKFEDEISTSNENLISAKPVHSDQVSGVLLSSSPDSTKLTDSTIAFWSRYDTFIGVTLTFAFKYLQANFGRGKLSENCLD